ncbi:hypothetical protein SSCH_1360002 [Syntrophaceticus schinkii]|uniref:Transposase DDE domain-containing protein n=2 Tax=Syntrophaceticus schinkii TaxID=499207 RepID=A0A0B7MBQ8_9FIRM|nr:hypothetical protein SSCH_1360002 [Syntrophaceticus schinkii]
MSPEEVWRFYNKRGTCELWINELKDGFAVDEASQHNFVKNEAYMLVKAISYNLMLWFKEATMPERGQKLPGKNHQAQSALCTGQHRG